MSYENDEKEKDRICDAFEMMMKHLDPNEDDSYPLYLIFCLSGGYLHNRLGDDKFKEIVLKDILEKHVKLS